MSSATHHGRNNQHQQKQNYNGVNLETVLSKISFCDKQCSNVNDNTFKDNILKHLAEKYNINPLERSFNILNPNILKNIRFHPHILSPITNGTTYLLYLTRISGVNCCFYVDRKLKDGFTYPKIHCVKYRFDSALFDGETVFSGELVRDNERRWSFLLDDILVYKGETAKDKNILSRFELIYSILNNEYIKDKFIEICPLLVKKLFNYTDISTMINNFIPSLPYSCKGVLFYTLSTSHSNFGYLLPKDKQIPAMNATEVDNEIQTKYPELLAKRSDIMCENDGIYSDDENYGCGVANVNANTTTSSSSGKLSPVTMISDDENNAVDLSVMTSSTSTTSTQQNGEELNPEYVVFKIIKTNLPDIYGLYTTEKGQNIKHSNALILTFTISSYLNNLFDANHSKLDHMVICKYSVHFNRWVPITATTKHKCFTTKQINDIETKLKSQSNIEYGANVL
jgi:hypothetical protein